MKYFTKEVQIALVAIVGIVILFFGLKFLKGLSVFSAADTYYAEFDDISGLTKSCPVYANGFQVGSVSGINYDYAKQGRIKASLDLDKAMHLPVGTRAEIESDLMGNVKVNLVMPAGVADNVAVGGTIDGGKALGALGKAGDMIPQIQKMLPKLDSIMASLNAILADPAIKNTLHNADKISSDLTQTTKQLNSLMAVVNNKVPALMDKADATLANTDKLTKNLSDLDVAATMAKVDATLNNVQEMTEKLNSNDGTLGLLMRDPGLYNNLTATMRDADSLVIDLKAHPKRYVHFSLFGGKNK